MEGEGEAEGDKEGVYWKNDGAEVGNKTGQSGEEEVKGRAAEEEAREHSEVQDQAREDG